MLARDMAAKRMITCFHEVCFHQVQVTLSHTAAKHTGCKLFSLGYDAAKGIITCFQEMRFHELWATLLPNTLVSGSFWDWCVMHPKTWCCEGGDHLIPNGCVFISSKADCCQTHQLQVVFWDWDVVFARGIWCCEGMTAGSQQLCFN